MSADETIIDQFVKAVDAYKDQPAFNYFDGDWKTLSYGDFASCVRGVASYLVSAGAQSGSRAAILSENRVEWCISYLGILMAGATAVPIDAELGRNEIEKFLVDSEPVVLFHSEKTREKLRTRIRTINFDSPLFKQLCRAQGEKGRRPISGEDVASIVYTSGTTGSPKGVMLTQRNLHSDATALMGFGFITRKDNLLAMLPFHHTYPFMCSFIVPLCSGAQITFPRGLKGPELVSTVRERGVTIFMSVPRLLDLLWGRITLEIKGMPRLISATLLRVIRFFAFLRKTTGMNPGKVIFRKVHRDFGGQFRFFTSGGAKLDAAIMEGLEGLGFTVLEGYGLTETSPVVTFNPLERRKPGSAGKPLPSVEINIIQPSESGEGEIAIRGPMVTKGYYKNPEATAQVLRDGWFTTGDIGYLDKEGYLYITGRKKEIIVLSSGKNVNPEEVEQEYLTIPLIKEIAVMERKEGDGPVSLHGIIVPDLDYARNAKIANLREVLKGEMGKVSSTLPAYRRVKGFTLHAGPLPRTPLGKLKRYAVGDLLKDESGEKAPREEDKALLDDDVGRGVLQSIGPLLAKSRTVISSDHLELDLGLDSLQRIELVVALENRFHIDLPETVASEVQTVGDLVTRIKGMVHAEQGVPQGEGPKKSAASAEPSEEEKQEIGLYQGKAAQLLVFVLIKILKGILTLFCNLEVKGIENIPSPPFILAPNHCSNIDGFVMGVTVPFSVFKILYFQGYRPYFIGQVSSRFARLAHVIRIDPETHVIKALRLSSYLLRQKRSICIFPEGGRSPDGDVMEFKKGVIVLAREHRVPVVPVRIRGTYEVLPRGAKLPRLKPVRVTIGQPLTDWGFVEKREGLDDDQALADALREKVRSLG